MSDDARHLVETKTRRARTENARVAIAEIAEEVRFDFGAGEELAIDRLVVEAGHRTAIEAERTRDDDQIGALERAVAERGLEDLRVVAGEPAARVGVREELGQMLVEIEIVADDGADRRPPWSCRDCLPKDAASAAPSPRVISRTGSAPGLQLAEVGPSFARSTISCRTASGTSRSSHLLWVRASRKIWSRQSSGSAPDGAGPPASFARDFGRDPAALKSGGPPAPPG